MEGKTKAFIIAVVVLAVIAAVVLISKGLTPNVPVPPKEVNIAGTVLHLPLDGNTNAKVGNNGVISGAPTPSTDAAIGTGAYKFSGAEGSISAGTSPNYNMKNAVSTSAWVKLNSLKHGYIVFKQDSFLMQLYNDNAGKIQFQGSLYYDNSASGGSTKQYVNVVSTGAMQIETGKWYHVVFVFDKTGSTNAVIYVNGKLAGTGSFSNSMIGTETQPIVIGGRGETALDRNIDATIDDVRVINRAVSLDEVTQMFNADAKTVVASIASISDLE